MPDICICGLGQKLVPEIIDALNGDGPAPDAVTIGDVRVYFGAPSARLKKHEHMHTVQCAREAPKWLRWAPFRVRVWAGTPKMLKKYVQAHQKYGYLNNPYEVEARQAENE